MTVEVWQRGVDDRVVNGFDRLGLANLRPATLKALDGGKPLVDRRRNEFLGDGPFENVLQSADPLIDDLPAQSFWTISSRIDFNAFGPNSVPRVREYMPFTSTLSPLYSSNSGVVVPSARR